MDFRYTRFIFLFFTFTVLIVAAPFSIENGNAGEIKIGFMQNATGIAAKDSVMRRRAADIALKEIEDSGILKGNKLVIVEADGQSTGMGAFEAADQLINKEKVVAIIGPTLSAQSAPVIPKIKQGQTPILLGATATKLTQDGDRWVLRLRASDALVSAAMVKFLKIDMGSKKLGVIYEDSPFGIGANQDIQAFASKIGLELGPRLKITEGDQTAVFKQTVKQFTDGGVDAVAVFISAKLKKEASEFMKERHAAKATFQVMGAPSTVNNSMIELAGDALNGAYGVVDGVFGTDPYSKKFEENYKKQFGDAPDAPQVFPYDVLHILAKSLAQNPQLSGAQLRDQIYAVKGYRGLYGPVNFDKTGEGIHQVTIVKITGKKLSQVKTVAVD